MQKVKLKGRSSKLKQSEKLKNIKNIKVKSKSEK